MAGALDDCRFQVARAKAKFDALQDDIVKFFEANPFPMRTVVEGEVQAIKIENPPAFPKEWGATAAEICLDCRNALNHLIVLLVTKAGGKIRTDHAFPMAEDRVGYITLPKDLTPPRRGKLSYRDRVLFGLAEPIKKRIDDFQPYNDGDQAFRNPLALLAEATNAQKHRAPQTAFAAIHLPAMLVRLPPSERVKSVTIQLTPEFAIQTDMTFDDGLVDSGITLIQKVKVDGLVGVEVVFGGNAWTKFLLQASLKRIIEVSGEIIESLAEVVDAPTP